MSLEQIITLAFVQGLTEFLPISSSGHLVLIPWLMGWKDQGLMMDVAAHIGTLVAVFIYFWRDVLKMIQGSIDLVFKRRMTDESWLVVNLVIATIPAVIVGFLIDTFVGDSLRSVNVIAVTGIIFGLLLYSSDRLGSQSNRVGDVTWKDSIFFGLAQSLALINGVSRSGVCMTAGRFMNYKRADAAHFAFLMAIPSITAAGTLKSYQLFKSGNFDMLNDALLMAGFSMVFGFMAIAFMMRWLKSSGFAPFVIYRLALGVGLLWAVASGIIANIN